MWSANAWRSVELADTSLTGARLRGKKLPDTGTVIELELEVPCHRIHVQATVAWSHDSSRTIGVQFEPLPKHRQVLVNNGMLESIHIRPGHARVLILADDPTIQTTLARAIAEKGYDVVSRSTPLDALQALEATAIDLVIVSSCVQNRGAYDLLDYLADEHPRIERVMLVDRGHSLTLCRHAPDHLLVHPTSAGDLFGVLDRVDERGPPAALAV